MATQKVNGNSLNADGVQFGSLNPGHMAYVLKDKASLDTFFNNLTADLDYSSYLSTVMYFPFSLKFQDSAILYTLTDIIKVAGADITVEDSIRLASGYVPNTSGERALLNIGNFDLETSPNFISYIKQYELYLPFYGFFTLDPHKYVNTHVKVEYAIDYGDGSCIIYLSTRPIDSTSEDDYIMIDSLACQLGIRFPYSTSNAADIKNQNILTTVSSAISILGSGVSIGTGIATGSVSSISSGLGGLGQGITGIIGAWKFNHPTASKSEGNDYLQLYSPLNIILRVIAPIPDFPDGFYGLYGRKCNQYLQLSTLTGYTKVGAVHVDNIPGATDGELTEIENLLKNGVIL